MKTEPTKNIAIRIPETLYRRYKIALATRGETMQKTIYQTIQNYIDNSLDTKANTQ